MRICRMAGLTALLLVAPAPLWAAEGGVLSINAGLTIWTWVLFLLTLGILSWKAFPAIAKGLETRQASIQAAIDSAREDRDEARRLLDEHQRQLDQARRESKDILQQGREAGERLREEILAQTRKDNEEMLERARRDLAREKDDLLESVRREAVDLALKAAEKLVRENLDDDANRRLVRDYIAEME
jgi:F-type H+-transporting ATPase subunit b